MPDERIDYSDAPHLPDAAWNKQLEAAEYSYQIDPRPANLGGGWRLCLLESGEEVGGGVFPLAEYATAENPEEASSYAYEDVLAEASAWLTSRGEN